MHKPISDRDSSEAYPVALVWDVAYKNNSGFTWCSSNHPLGAQPVPVPILGNLTEPFLLVSTMDKDGKISLKALPPNSNDQYRFLIWCRLDEQYFQDCRKGVKKGLDKLFYWTEAGVTETVDYNYNINHTVGLDNIAESIDDAEEYF